MARQFDTDVGVLTTGDAKKLGLFRPFDGMRKLAIPQTVWVERPHAGALTFYCPRDAEIANDFPPHDRRAWVPTTIQLKAVPLKFGDRICFLCPYDKKICTKLFFYKGIIASGRAFKCALEARGYYGVSRSVAEARRRILHLAKRRRWSGKKRLLFIHELENLEGLDRTLDQRLDMERRRDERDRIKFLWESRPHSTTKALDEGQGLGQFNCHHVLLQRTEEWLLDPQPSSLAPPPAPIDSVEKYPELDIRILIQRGELDSPMKTSRRLWALPRSQDDPWIIMHVVPRSDDVPLMIIEYWIGGRASEFQKIELVRAHNSRRPRRFICPQTCLPVDVLYLRNNFFASRQAHRLRFPAAGKKGLFPRPPR